MKVCTQGGLGVAPRDAIPKKQLWLKGCCVLREALSMSDCWILKSGFCTAGAFIQHSHRARIYADIWESKLELSWICAQTLPAAAVQHHKGKASPNHILLTAQCGNLGLKMNIWVKA